LSVGSDRFCYILIRNAESGSVVMESRDRHYKQHSAALVCRRRFEYISDDDDDDDDANDTEFCE